MHDNKSTTALPAVPSAAPGVHEKVYELCMRLGRGSVLDAPAGAGSLARRLADAGCSVQAFDIDVSVAAAGPDVPYTQGNLDNDLPYSAGSFDLVVCVEAIEHIEDVYHAFREFARVLKPGGRLIVTTPNIQSCLSRVKFFLFGSCRTFDSLIKTSQGVAAHIHPVGFPELEYALRKAGFMIEKIETNRYLGACRPLRAILTAAFRWGNALLNRAYNPALCTETLLFGEIVIVQAYR